MERLIESAPKVPSAAVVHAVLFSPALGGVGISVGKETFLGSFIFFADRCGGAETVFGIPQHGCGIVCNEPRAPWNLDSMGNRTIPAPCAFQGCSDTSAVLTALPGLAKGHEILP